MSALNEVERVVDHCNEIESSIEDCLQVLQKICIKKPLKGEKDELSKKSGKHNGKKGLDADGKLKFPPPPIFMCTDVDIHCIIEKTNKKLDTILARQREIIETIDKIQHRSNANAGNNIE